MMSAAAISPFVYEAHQSVAVPLCPLCRRANASTPATDRYGFLVGTSMCACGFAYLNPQLSASGYLDFYANAYRPLINEMRRKHGLSPLVFGNEEGATMRGLLIAHEAARLWPVRPVSVLDVGGSAGALLTVIARVWTPLSVTVLDPNPDELAQAAKRGYQTILGTAESRPALPRHDVIVCAETLDHVHDPLAVLTWMHDALAPGGWAFMDIVDASRFARLCAVSGPYAWKLDHPCYWCPKNLKAALLITGWRIKAQARYGDGGYHYAVWCESASSR